eukprot:6199506-Pleurochrysis_carterae.AAC.1
MPRSRARPHRSKTIVKVKVKARKPKLSAPQFFEKSALSYDAKASQFKNYKNMALMVDANQIGAERDKIRGFKPRVKVPVAASTDESCVHPLDLEVPEAIPTVRQVPHGEAAVLSALIAKHGDDYTAMARDMRLNKYQHTAAHLRHRIEKLNKQKEKDETAAKEAEAAGAPAPAPRYAITRRRKNPNRAFQKRSTHFC